VGHVQGQYVATVQPMKIAASEGLWETADPAPFAVVALISQREGRNVWELPIPGVVSLLLYNRFGGEVRGINDLQAEYEQTYGPGNYVPPVALTFWTFRVMVGVGVLMTLVALVALYLLLRRRLDRATWFVRLLPLAIILPYLATSTGWILTETGRQPWIVYGLMATAAGVSPTNDAFMVLVTMVGFTLIYGVLAVVMLGLVVRRVRAGLPEATSDRGFEHEAEPALGLGY
jgi:cytochrome d ubiquinol oxidase subunit I